MTNAKKVPPTSSQDIGLKDPEIIPNGRRIEISMSKIRKIIAIKKNRIEKGIREVFLGSKPHSKGDLFSWSSILFFERRAERIKRIDLKSNATIKAKIKI